MQLNKFLRLQPIIFSISEIKTNFAIVPLGILHGRMYCYVTDTNGVTRILTGKGLTGNCIQCDHKNLTFFRQKQVSLCIMNQNLLRRENFTVIYRNLYIFLTLWGPSGLKRLLWHLVCDVCRSCRRKCYDMCCDHYEMLCGEMVSASLIADLA